MSWGEGERGRTVPGKEKTLRSNPNLDGWGKGVVSWVYTSVKMHGIINFK